MSHQDNGKPETLRDVLQGQIDALQDDPSLMRDLLEPLPGLRALIVGGRRAGHVWPGATMRVRRLGCVLEIVVCIPCLEVECRYVGTSWHSLLETIDEDVRANTIQWAPDYKGRQRIERRYSS